MQKRWVRRKEFDKEGILNHRPCTANINIISTFTTYILIKQKKRGRGGGGVHCTNKWFCHKFKMFVTSANTSFEATFSAKFIAGLHKKLCSAGCMSVNKLQRNICLHVLNVTTPLRFYNTPRKEPMAYSKHRTVLLGNTTLTPDVIT